jgi:hypothetical protein
MTFLPSFEVRCRICETVPTVVIPGHAVEVTELCGVCFFGDRIMLDWDLWDEPKDPTE